MSDDINKVVDLSSKRELKTITDIVEAIRKHTLAHNDILLYFPNGMQVTIQSKNKSLLPKEI